MNINHHPGRRDLTVFGLLLPVFFAVAGFLVGRRAGSGAVSQWVWGVGAAISVAYLAVPSARRPIFVGWSYLTYPVSWVASHALFLAIFWLVFTPIGLLMRLLGHDPLSRGFDRSATTYWAGRENHFEVGRYFRQF